MQKFKNRFSSNQFEVVTMNEDEPKHKPRIFQLNDKEEKFEELEIDMGTPLHRLMDSDNVILFLSSKFKTAWLWIGSNASLRMAFIGAREVSPIRDRYGTALMKIKTVKERKADLSFLIFVGLKEPPENSEEPEVETQPLTVQFKFEKEKELLLELERYDVPEGYERELVISQGKIYKYHIGNFMGTTSPELISLREIVPNGMYPFKEYMTRILFIGNVVQIVEFLKKKKNS